MRLVLPLLLSFTGPAAAIASIAAEASGPGVEVELLTGIPDPDRQEPTTANARSRVRGLLGSERRIALRWQGRAAEAVRRAVAGCETTATVKLTPSAIQFETDLAYEILHQWGQTIVLGCATAWSCPCLPQWCSLLAAFFLVPIFSRLAIPPTVFWQASARVLRKSCRSMSSLKMSSRRSPRLVTW